MIAREWKCRVPLEKFKDFIPYLLSTGVEDSQSVKGFQGYQILKREIDSLAEVTLITYWSDIESVKDFAGEDIEVARLYPEDDAYDLDSDEFVRHYEIIGKSKNI